jgi:hypothetical protein
MTAWKVDPAVLSEVREDLFATNTADGHTFLLFDISVTRFNCHLKLETMITKTMSWGSLVALAEAGGILTHYSHGERLSISYGRSGDMQLISYDGNSYVIYDLFTAIVTKNAKYEQVHEYISKLNLLPKATIPNNIPKSSFVTLLDNYIRMYGDTICEQYALVYGAQCMKLIELGHYMMRNGKIFQYSIDNYIKAHMRE